MRFRALLPLLSLLAAVPAAAHEGHLGVPAAPVATRPELPEPAPGSALPVELGGPFTLTDPQGRRVTDADFRGRYMLLFFGYANCPGICPLGLQNMTAAVDLLGESGRRVAPVLITVDPERDTPQALGAVTARLGPHLVALTGTPTALAAVRRAYRVESTPAGRDWRGRTLFHHGTFIYLVGPDGRVVALFPPVLEATVLAAAVRRYLAMPAAGQEANRP